MPIATERRPVKIAVRVRPFLPHENPDDTLEVDGRNIRVVNLRDRSQVYRYSFASTYTSTSTQAEIFSADVEPHLPSILEGKSLTIFSYGVTGSGKTHTMQGFMPSASVEGAPAVLNGVAGKGKGKARLQAMTEEEEHGAEREQEGIIPRTVQMLMDEKENDNGVSVEIEMSMYEIYNEAVYDLLEPRETSGTGLPIRENGNRKIFVAGLSQRSVATYEEFVRLYATATSNRSVAATLLNASSSRSHAVLSLNVSTRRGDARTSSRVNLIDLAGSENNKLTGNTKERMTESSAINKSLFVLGQTVQALNTGATRIPYRDSKMTMIMRDALGGTSLSLLICNLAPGGKFYNDTVNTLNFASRTKLIENRVAVNDSGKGKVVTAAAGEGRIEGVKSSGVAQARAPRKSAPARTAMKQLNAVAAAPRSSEPARNTRSRKSTGQSQHLTASNDVAVKSDRGDRPSEITSSGAKTGTKGRASRASMGRGARNSSIGVQGNGGGAPATKGARRLSTIVKSFKDDAKEDGRKLGLTDEELEAKVSELIDRKLRNMVAPFGAGTAADGARPAARRPSIFGDAPFAFDQTSVSSVSADANDTSSRDLSVLVDERTVGLRKRLETLEKRMMSGEEDDGSETGAPSGRRDLCRSHDEHVEELASLLSPTTREKTARACIALARAAESRNDLSAAMEHYSKGLLYAHSEDVRLCVEELREAARRGWSAAELLERRKVWARRMDASGAEDVGRKRAREEAGAEEAGVGEDELHRPGASFRTPKLARTSKLSLPTIDEDADDASPSPTSSRPPPPRIVAAESTPVGRARKGVDLSTTPAASPNWGVLALPWPAKPGEDVAPVRLQPRDSGVAGLENDGTVREG